MSSISMEEEKALVLACVNGDAAVWNEFVRRYERFIRATAAATRIRYRAYQCEVPDLTGYVYEKLLEDRCRRLRAWRNESKFSTYLVQVTKNLCLDYIKKHNRTLLVEDQGKLPDWLKESLGPGPLEPEESQEIRLRAAIRSLPPRQAMIMQLRLADRSLRDIAALLGIPEGTVATENSRALETLRNRLTRSRDESGEFDR
ncbi:MAG: sigma-70 family RNA polymerase sigma factor [Candidatus Hydrogenedentes bacterium]|nr:sigma-70 family RNA polymerase sigma factor [Candidatus Hydrogenedentota bacterium]